MLLFGCFQAKKWLGCLLLLVLAVFLIAICRVPVKRFFFGVKKDVTYLGTDMSGLLKEEVYEIVGKSAGRYFSQPVNAVADDVWAHGMIPELFGYELEIDETVAKILEAPEGRQVFPEIKIIKPERTLAGAEKAVYRGNPGKTQAVLMINVAWGNEYLPDILAVLAQEKVKATFFLVGRWAEQNKGLVLDILNAGHEIASHGFDDGIVMQGLSREKAYADIRKSLDIIENITNCRVAYFTPHKGEFDEGTVSICSQLGLSLIMWSLDTADWLGLEVDDMLSRTVEKVFNGAIILMHPTAKTGSYLQEALPLIKEKGLEVVTISALLNPDWLKRGDPK